MDFSEKILPNQQENKKLYDGDDLYLDDELQNADNIESYANLTSHTNLTSPTNPTSKAKRLNSHLQYLKIFKNFCCCQQ